MRRPITVIFLQYRNIPLDVAIYDILSVRADTHCVYMCVYGGCSAYSRNKYRVYTLREITGF